jgi:hypothetical protein
MREGLGGKCAGCHCEMHAHTKGAACARAACGGSQHGRGGPVARVGAAGVRASRFAHGPALPHACGPLGISAMDGRNAHTRRRKGLGARKKKTHRMPIRQEFEL